mgnify:FL=1
MGEVLSQSEIDDLLKALSSGELDVDEMKNGEEKQVKNYDFARPSKFSKEHLRTLEIIFEHFGRLLATNLPAYLRKAVSVDVVNSEVVIYSEFSNALSNPVLLGVVSMAPLSGNMVMEIASNLGFAFVDRLLGGAGAALDKERDAVASRPFLTPSDVALLLDISVSTVYRCFYSGIIKAVRIRRKTLVRREDLDKYFEDAGPYRKRSYKRKQEQEYYTLQEIMDKYKIGRKAVWGRCDRLGIPKVYEGRNTFYSKKLIDANFSELLDVIDIDNYYTLSQIMEMYNMTQGATLCFVKYHAVPRVKRNGRSYYSKVHIDCIKHKTDEIDPDWYSYEEAMQKYGITKDQVSYTLKTYSIKTEKRGKFTMIYRTDFDNIMHQRLQNSTPLIKSNGDEKVVFTAKQQEKICPATPEGYYSTDEVAEMFKISIKHAGVITRENNIPKIALKGFNFYEKGSIDLLYNKKNKYAEITDWITPEEMRTTFKMTADGVRSFIHRHKIPAKVEYGSTYYSKQHIEEIKNGYFVGRDRYYSVEEW